MTRKDFVAIAHVLDANAADLNLVLDMADVLAESNPRFDRARFVSAATLTLQDDADRSADRLRRARAGAL